VYIGTVALGLTIIEMSEQVPARYVDGKYVRETDYVAPKRRRGWADQSWTTTKAFASTRLCLQVYSPYPRTAWVRRWNETKEKRLTDRLDAIVSELERAAADVARLAQEGERQAELERARWEAQRDEWNRKEAVRRTAEAVANSGHELLRIIAAWSKA
jgi:hypothetical protein